MRRPRGSTLLEVLVALVVLAVGVTACQQLVVRSLGTVATDADLTRAMLLARAVLAEAEVSPPPFGHVAGPLAPPNDDLLWERDVAATAHPALREVRVRVHRAGTAGAELLEVIRVPAL